MPTTSIDFTVADVLAWARTKPADTTYRYTDVGNCALCQFLQETGRAMLPRVAPCAWREVGSAQYIQYPPELETPLAGPEHEPPIQTFGALVARLEALCPDTPVTKSDWLAIDAYMTGDADAKAKVSA